MSQNDPPPIATGDWNVEGQEAEGKSVLPKWLLGCGCGCLVVLLLGIGTLFLGAKWASSNFGPEEQWAELAELLPHEERPENLEPVVAPVMGLVNWFMNMADSGMSIVTMIDKEAGLSLFLMGVDTSKLSSGKDSSEPDVGVDMELHGIFEPSDDDAEYGVERGFVEIQGRQAAWMYGQHNSNQPILQGFTDDRNLQTFVDLSEDDKVLLMVVGHTPSGRDEERPPGRVTDAEIQTLLAPFKVWERP